MMDAMNGGPGDWWMGGMLILSILFWIVIIAGVLFMLKWLMRRDKQLSPSESPIAILEKRYAEGEIDQETFERMKNDMGGKQ